MDWFFQREKNIYWKVLELALTTSLHQVMIHRIISSLCGQNQMIYKSLSPSLLCIIINLTIATPLNIAEKAT